MDDIFANLAVKQQGFMTELRLGLLLFITAKTYSTLVSTDVFRPHYLPASYVNSCVLVFG